MKVPINGGPALPIFEGGNSGHWAENDSVVFQAGGEIHIVPSSGGESTVLLAATLCLLIDRTYCQEEEESYFKVVEVQQVRGSSFWTEKQVKSA